MDSVLFIVRMQIDDAMSMALGGVLTSGLDEIKDLSSYGRI